MMIESQSNGSVTMMLRTEQAKSVGHSFIGISLTLGGIRQLSVNWCRWLPSEPYAPTPLDVG
jgi:hypothetical protein